MCVAEPYWEVLSQNELNFSGTDFHNTCEYKVCCLVSVVATVEWPHSTKGFPRSGYHHPK